MAKAKKTEEEVKPEEVQVETPVVETTDVTEEVTEKPEEATETAEAKPEKTAKAGKRSEKALKEVEEKVAKEERKAKGDTAPQTNEAGEVISKRGPKPKVRPLLERRGKAYRKAAEQLEAGKIYSLKEALELATKTSVGKFDASVEIHVNLGVDPRQADQNIRSTVALPHGTGKTVRVAVFAPADSHEAATKAGADVVGEDDFLQKLDKEQIDFDILVSTPQFMPKLGKYARLLGPKGLMPNPKSGTVTTNIAKAVKEAKAGRVEYRVDKQAIVHQAVGKVSFGPEKLLENTKTFVESLNGVKPASLKSTYIKGFAVSTTMGPGIKVDLSSL